MITTKQIRMIYGLLGELGLKENKAFFVNQFTEGRTKSIKDMKRSEANELVSWIVSEKLSMTSKMRKKVVHYLCLMGYTNSGGGPDFNRINGFIVKIGSRNPKRKPLHFMSPGEVLGVLNQVEAMYRNELKRKTSKAVR